MPQQRADFDAQKTYSDAAAEYDRVSARYWPFAARTVERLALRPGMSVLDVACGNGAGALALGGDAPRVRKANTAWVQANGITTIRSTAHYAVATKRV